MKFNKWTLGLAAIGVVSLASAAKAEQTATGVLTALTSTTLSGYVDTSMQWNFGTGNGNNPPYAFGGPSKADGFNLNVAQISLATPMDELEWATGYRLDLWAGPDANQLGTLSAQSGGASSDIAIRQAYVALRAPIGNGIDFKIGVFDTIIGYESVASPNNPNYTRSYGQALEPQTHTGILASYRVCDNFSVAAGVANTIGPSINSRAHPPTGDHAESYKTYMASIAITAPDHWGFLSGSTMYGGIVNGFSDSTFGDRQTSGYVGATLATPVNNLKIGAAFDYLDVDSTFGDDGTAWVIALYSSFQATEKLGLHLRGEYVDDSAGFFANGIPGTGFKTWEFTGTLQYDLWKNVLSRLEVRWDHSDSGRLFGSSSGSLAPTRKNATMLAANLIYKF
jgi:hypothetical protein